jgi:hypothetical protein
VCKKLSRRNSEPRSELAMCSFMKLSLAEESANAVRRFVVATRLGDTLQYGKEHCEIGGVSGESQARTSDVLL